MSLNLPYGCHAATIVRKEEVDNFLLTETVYAPNLKLPKHAHEQACFSLVLQGSFEQRYGTKRRTCEPSTVVFIPEGEVHSDYFLDNGSRCFHFEIARQWLGEIGENSATPQHSVAFKDGTISYLVIKLYREFGLMDPFASLAIEGLTLEMLAEVSRRQVTGGQRLPPPWLERVVELLHDQFSEQLTLLTIAKAAGVHPAHLAREFKRYYRITVGDYILQLRMASASRALCTSTTALSQIALANGFADQSHFSRTFKRFTGMTPAAYRNLTSSR